MPLRSKRYICRAEMEIDSLLAQHIVNAIGYMLLVAADSATPLQPFFSRKIIMSSIIQIAGQRRVQQNAQILFSEVRCFTSISVNAIFCSKRCIC